MTAPLLVHFTAGDTGEWAVREARPVRGPALPTAPRLAVTEGAAPPPGRWNLRGVVSSLRYTTAAERAELAARQEGLGRPAARSAALIPIRKTSAWWALAQDERRAIMEERSRHNAVGMEYLPAVARRLHHARDLGEAWDFLTWFEYAPEDEGAFEELLRRLRASEEWEWVEAETELRLDRS